MLKKGGVNFVNEKGGNTDNSFSLSGVGFMGLFCHETICNVVEVFFTYTFVGTVG